MHAYVVLEALSIEIVKALYLGAYTYIRMGAYVCLVRIWLCVCACVCVCAYVFSTSQSAKVPSRFV
jgi:hypothetical protein